MSYQCRICGETHAGLPDIGYEWPDPYFGVPELERTLRIRSTTDTCVIDEEDYFIRGVILIPVHGERSNLGLGVWISQKRENFETYLASFDSSDIGPFFGWLSNRLPFYERDTWALKTMARFQGGNRRPLIEIEPSDHPLSRDYAEGISLNRAWQYVHWYDRQRKGG
jgi:hypothetical protein